MINVVCAVIQNSDGQVLACQRARDKMHAGKWEFPGGKIKCREQPEDALVREIAEELGCGLNIVRQLQEVNHDYDTFSIRLLPFLCTIGVGEIRKLEHNDVQWISLERCNQLDWSAADIPIWSGMLPNK